MIEPVRINKEYILENVIHVVEKQYIDVQYFSK